jgi:predicted dehydrogenase
LGTNSTRRRSILMAASSDRDTNVTRREFIGSAALTGAGVAAGLSFYFSRPHRDEEAVARLEKPENHVRLGFIGVGNRGMSLLRSALQVPGCRPVAIADVRESQRAEAVKDIKAAREKAGEADYKVEAHEDYRRLLDRKDVEAVFIATPHYLHGPMALDAIEAGKHIYCEKAMAYTIGENQDIYDRVKAGARTSDGHLLVFQVGHQRHYAPLYIKVKEMVDQGVIGDVAAIRAQWNSNDPVRRACPDPEEEKLINWRLYSEFSGGLTTEFASHQIDVANWVLGTHPDSVCGFGGVDWYADGRDTHDNIHLIFNYKVPVLDRDAAGRPKSGADGKWLYKQEGERIVHRNVRFDYMSIMENAHLGASELVMGTYGTIEVSLQGGGEFFKEKKAMADPNRIAEGTNPKRSHQKRILKTGSTVDPNQTSIRRPKGDPIQGDKDKTHWVQYTESIHGSYDTHETLLALSGFADSIRRSREGKDFADTLAADVEIGLWGAVPSLMANIAMREERTVYWHEFFPASQTASVPRKDAPGSGG